MMMRGLLFAFAATATITTPGTAAELLRDPIGETASYVVDRAASRTSSLVLGGTLDAVVTGALPDNDPPAYEVKLDYNFRIRFVGTQQGTEVMPFDQVYFTPEFLAQLRIDGEYHSNNFKVRHLGYGHARNMDGAYYPNCDKLLIYDVATAAASPLTRLGAALVGRLDHGDFAGPIEDLEIVAHISYGQPVIGAVKLDVTGVYNGIDVKAGADYKTP